MASTGRELVEFMYDISCPFAYIASTRIEALAARANAELIWSPVLLGAIYAQTAAPQGAAGSASDVFNAAKKHLTSRAFARTIKRYQIPLNQPRKHPQKTTAALRLLYHLPPGERATLTKALFRAYWVDNKDISIPGVLLDVVKQSGIPSAGEISEADWGSRNLHEALRTATTTAVARGAPGVPSFWISGERWTDFDGKVRQGRLYWGQDRMHFVEAGLLALNRGIDYQEVPALSGLQPRCLREPQTTRPTVVEFWYDFSSPWAFLGWTQLARLKREAGSRLTIELKPILLGALFREIGSPMMPLLAMSPQKQAYMRRDLADWARHWNALSVQSGSPEKAIEFTWPDIFPVRSPTLLRVALVDPKTVPVLFRASWEQNIDVSNAATLAKHLSASGFDATNLLKKASQQPIKDQLRANTEQAKTLGLCGVPTFRVLHNDSNGEWVVTGGVVNGGLVWGQDELGVVEDLVNGWREEDSTVVADVDRRQQAGRAML